MHNKIHYIHSHFIQKLKKKYFFIMLQISLYKNIKKID